MNYVGTQMSFNISDRKLKEEQKLKNENENELQKKNYITELCCDRENIENNIKAIYKDQEFFNK